MAGGRTRGIFETRIACLMYADDCVLFASDEADLQLLYTSSAVVLEAEGKLIRISKTEASVCRVWVYAPEWPDPQLQQAGGTRVDETIAFKHIGQR